MNKTSSTDKIILYIETLLHPEILQKITMTKKLSNVWRKQRKTILKNRGIKKQLKKDQCDLLKAGVSVWKHHVWYH